MILFRIRPAVRCGTVFLTVAGLASYLTLMVSVRADESSVKEQVRDRLSSLSSEHPRLFLERSEIRRIRQAISDDRVSRTVFEQVRKRAKEMVGKEPLERKKTGKRLLGVSRTYLRRITHLALTYRLTGKDRFLEQAKKELLAASNFSDWNPSHFLDVAEMTAALAIGYDWLFGALDDDERSVIRSAIVEKGLKPSMDGGWWVNTTNNWNQVCHGGLTLGALAIGKQHGVLAEQIITRAVKKIPRAMNQYSPDGAYPEGPGYWSYGTTYNVLFLDALRKALGTDFGRSDLEGFMETGSYFLHVQGPSGFQFNYSDGGREPGLTPAVAWFARETNDPALLRWTLPRVADGEEGGRLFPFFLIWGTPFPDEVPEPDTLHWRSRGKTPVSFHRTGWNKNDAFIAVKGGSPSTNHAHMDIGTFVYDTKGERWATDLGAQSYHSLESAGVDLWNSSQDSERWTVFRLNNKSHNTLVVNDQHQLVGGHAPIRQTSLSFPRAHTVVDMSPVYEGQLNRAVRGVALERDGTALIQDQIRVLDREATVRWGMVTRAEVDVRSSREAILTKDGKTIQLKVLAPERAELTTYNTADPPRSYDATNEGTRMIGFRCTVPSGTGERLAVVLDPSADSGAPPELIPLSDW